ncbi:MAG: hypothetical protein V4438_01700 [Patescibacteria group bacterium]
MQKKNTANSGDLGAKAALATAAIAAAAGAYFLYGTKEGKKAGKKVKSWALKAKGEVLEKIEKMKDVSEESYNGAVSTVMDKYGKLMKEHGDDVAVVKKELHSYWNHLKKHLKTAAKKGKK